MCCALAICLDSLTFQPWIFLSLHNISALEVTQFILFIDAVFSHFVPNTDYKKLPQTMPMRKTALGNIENKRVM